MSLISRQISALFNGVSQQPATLRLPSQAEAVVNGYATVVDGLGKRPPFEHVAKVSDDDLTDAFIHSINRDTTERYLVVLTDGDLKVLDALTGEAKTVAFPLGKTYLDLPEGASAKDSFAVVSIADYSFVVNKSVVVGTKAAPTATPAGFSHWFLPTGWGSGDEESYYVIAQGINRGKKQTFVDLPGPDALAPDVPPTQGDVWKITGAGENSFGGYYVIRNGGVWQETHVFDGALALDEDTMPMALIREADGTFTLTDFAWKPRFMGDNESNPPASFVGRTINDVFYYKNRLGFVSSENVVFSCAGDYGNFWRTTVTALLDSDIVDVAVSSTKVSLLKYAVPFNSGLMLFADQTQFSLNVDQLLTPTSVSIDTATEYEMDAAARPEGIGSEVYFATPSGAYSRIREYFVQEDGIATDALDITAHVPRYLPAGIHKLVGNSNEDVLFAVSRREGFAHRLYVYKFFWSGDERVQSSWSYWEMQASDEVLSMTILENELFILVKRADGAYLERCDIQSGSTYPGLPFNLLLDRRCEPELIYFVENTTDILLPYPLATAAEKAALRIVVTGGPTPGKMLDQSQFEWLNDWSVRYPSVLPADGYTAGLNYNFEFEFSEQFMMNGDAAITTGRMQLRTFVIYYTDTAFFKTSVAPYGNDPLVEAVVPAALSEFTGKTLGEASLVLGAPAFHTGSYAFQVYGNSRVARIKLVNDTPFQSKFQSAEFEALYHNRARSV